MNSWSKRRKILYLSVVAIFLVGAVGVPAFIVFYKPATCDDGIWNGSEKGVDCGGKCQRLCQSAFQPPVVTWTRYEQIAPGLYNMAAYIYNPNADGEALNVPYHMVMYDKAGIPITDTPGTVNIPPKRSTLAFQSAIDVNKSIPASRLFEFTAAPDWRQKADPLAALSYDSGVYSEDATGSSLVVTLKNSGVEAIRRVSVYAILKDKDDNVIGFSKTIVDEIPARGSAVAPFTWPVNRKGAVISQEILPVAE